MLDVFSYLALRQRNALFHTSSLSFIQSFNLSNVGVFIFLIFQGLNSKGLHVNIKRKRKSSSTYYLSIKVFFCDYTIFLSYVNTIIVLKLLTQRAWSQWVPVLAPSHLLPLQSRSDCDEERRQKNNPIFDDPLFKTGAVKLFFLTEIAPKSPLYV